MLILSHMCRSIIYLRAIPEKNTWESGGKMALFSTNHPWNSISYQNDIYINADFNSPM